MVNYQNIKNDKGITLTVLVITIIIMLILAGVTITSVVGDQGIINKSEDLSNNTNETINQKTEELNNMINELDEIMNPWEQNKTVITKKLKSETKTLNVGDDYTYDCGVSGYTGGWKVLGAENGKLLIMSTVDIGTLSLEGKEGYNTGVKKLNDMCSPYGMNARSITVEDINRVTGYDPTSQGDGTIFGAENFYEYGNRVTYTASGSTTTNEKTYTNAISKFEHPDGRKIGVDNVTSIMVKSTAYYYYPYSLTSDNSTTGECKGITTDSSEYKLLFRNADNTANCAYWLASSYVYTDTNKADFGMYCVSSGGNVNYYSLWNSSDDPHTYSFGVRAVVQID